MGNKIQFLGHSAFLIQTSGEKSILIDPWLDNPQAPKDVDIPTPDLLLITHAHGDHLGNAVNLGSSSKTEVIAIHEIQQYLLTKGVPNVTGMNIGGTYSTKGISITMVQAIHSSSFQEGNEIIYGGDAAGFVIRLEDGTSIYHAGDTGLFGDMALIGELYSPQIAILPIGNHYVMGPNEAAYAVKLIKPKAVIPMHYGSFPVLTGTVEEFEEAIKKLGQEVEVVGLAPGQIYEPRLCTSNA
ncbi:hypothetical protein DBT_1642 [Dissulfuribacter thermophilus]|uniref:UPF0173 metal-dependent hydrolase DBT_1642 n=1 Tax=Dissulfuribacter thermophilus TaxID=1156395 RepID=A0A1B9F4G7_9BACT|nr:metal-dependent hydrolase [Dissulfuribacter thermophilus]OCC14847.1 hypothetical protein DBT_1642 [Dissulfuribacter thermophilus]